MKIEQLINSVGTVICYTQTCICRVQISHKIILSRIFHQPDNRTQYDNPV